VPSGSRAALLVSATRVRPLGGGPRGGRGMRELGAIASREDRTGAGVWWHAGGTPDPELGGIAP
jgi:hypothetical protein